MKYITCYETIDGQIHKTHADAKSHADRVYGNLLLNVSKHLVPMSYTQITNYIDQNLHLFLKLAELKKDLVVLSEENDDD